jgi:ubiquinone/menaquinone biosynthesis C-methylase UbiE|tara:strand:- start:50 stop:649 length:600 start_codon:yes stop_codon:yes gene_type:complete
LARFLHVGCGQKTKSETTEGFNSVDWDEVRFDIDERVNPDIQGTILNMENVDSGSVDAVYSSHNIEHVYPHEVDIVIKEFVRVLSPEGFAVIACPDLQSVCKLVAEGKLLEAAGSSPAGPIAPIDILYGHRPSLQQGNIYMAHKTGFTLKVLMSALKANGFKSVVGMRREDSFNLYAAAFKETTSPEKMREVAKNHFPS